MVFSTGGMSGVEGRVTGVGVGFSLICCVDSSMFLMVSTARNNGYSLRLLMRKVAKSSGFSFEEIYWSASGWTNVP